jgi:uncharacterized protein (DUF983 family)
MWNPYEGLDPEAQPGPSGPRVREVGAFRVLLRGLRKRCPRCGEGRVFVGWFQPMIRCPTCDLTFAAEEGGFLGAMTVNYGVAIGAWLLLLVIVLILTVPEVPVVPLLAGSVAVLVLVPLWFYPRSKMLWAAVEHLVARAQPGYRPAVVRDPRRRDLE